MFPRRAIRTLLAAMTAVVLLAGMQSASPRAAAGGPQVSQALRNRVAREGRVRVIVELNLPSGRHVPEGSLRDAIAVLTQRRAISAVGARVLSRLAAPDHRVIHRYQTVPYLALDITPAALAAIESSGTDVVRVMEDTIVRPDLADSVPLIEADQAWASGYDGAGTVIAVLDTGVDSSHPFLSGKVVEEACYSSTVAGTSQSVCPNGLDAQLGPGSAAPCSLSECIHGTHVAGIAAGNGATAGQSFSGVARNAHLMAIQVFSQVIDPASCGGLPPCAGAFTSDIIAGLERVYAVSGQLNIVSVNMSLGGAQDFTAPCDSEPYKPAIDNLRSIGIATVIAAGNNGSTSAISSPACISSAISVGSTDKSDVVSWFSNVASFLSLFAPGESITSSVPGGGYAELSGTSMAAPHVAGTWAILRQAVPSADVSTILGTLQQTGLPIADTRFLGTVTVPRVRVFHALAALVPVTNPAPQIAAISPARRRAGGALSLTVTGSDFDGFSVVRWNGAVRPATVVSTTKVLATIPATDLAAAGTAEVSVFTPAPGGGETASLPFIIDPPPTLTPSSTLLGPGGAETVTLANGFGGSTDWFTLAATGSPDAAYLQWTIVGTGVTDRTWTIPMPTAAGTYEFRYFSNNARAAASPPVTVDASLNPVPAVQSLSPARAVVGASALTLTVSGTSFVPASVVFWNGAARPTTVVSATQLQAAIGAGDLAATGSVQVTVVSPAPGGGASSGLTFTISPAPSLAVSSTNVVGGTSDTMTLTNGLGGSGDWLALASTAAGNTSYVQYTYVGAGVTTRTWTVTMPSTPGSYEFRLFPNNGYTRAATSPPITVRPGVPALTSLSPASGAMGSPGFTLSLTGSGFAPASIVRWNGADRPTTFVSDTQLRAAIPSTDLAAIGVAQVTVFSPGPDGGASVPLPFNISAAPALSVSATSVAGGASITATLTNGFGGSFDWLALASTTAPNTSYVQFVFVGAGVTSRTWTVAMPASGGTYEFRLFPNNGYTRAATSPPVTVLPGPSPVPVIGSLSPGSGAAGGSAFTLTVTGSSFSASSAVRWNGSDRPTTFVSSTQLRAAIGSGDLAAAGTAQVTVFSPPPGGGSSAALPFTIAAPSLTVSAMTVSPGATVTVTLTNGFGGSFDWLALAPTTAPSASYLQYTYVGGGVTSRTWTVTMPAVPGTYEFRLFINNGYMRVATSPPVTVQ